MARSKRTAAALAVERLDDRLAPAGLPLTTDTSWSAVPPMVPPPAASSFAPPLPPGTFQPSGAATQADGKIVFVGQIMGDQSGYAYHSDIGMLRVNADGTPDPTFNNGNILRIRFSADLGAYSNHIVVGPDGKIVVMGTIQPVTDVVTIGMSSSILARVNPNGTLDASFDGDGKLSFDLVPESFGDYTVTLAVDGEGRVIVVGSPEVYSYDLLAIRFNTDGSLDSSFDGDGRATVSIPLGQYGVAQVHAVAVTIDGKVVLGSSGVESTTDPNGPSGLTATRTVFAIARLNADGSLDTGFDGDGVLFVPLTTTIAYSNYLSDLLVGADGRIVLAGSDGYGSPLIIRLTADGALDTSFDGDGIKNDFPLFAGIQTILHGPGGTLLYGGYARLVADYFGVVPQPSSALIGRLLDDGTHDPAFPVTTIGETDVGGVTDLEPLLEGAVLVSRWSSFGVMSADGTSFRPILLPAAIEWPNPYRRVNVPDRSASGDLTGDGVKDIVFASSPGDALLAVVNGDTGERLIVDFRPYESTFTGGLFVAAADLDGDGQVEVIVAPDRGGSARIQVFRLVGGALTPIANFFGIADEAFRGGASVTAGDFNSDGVADLVVGAGLSGGPRVTVYDGKSLAAGKANRVNDFFGLTDSGFRGGVYVAAGDLNGDGVADLAVGAGPGGGPRVRVLDGTSIAAGNPDPAMMADFFVHGESDLRGGVAVRIDNITYYTRLFATPGEGTEGTRRYLPIYTPLPPGTEPFTDGDFTTL